MSYLHLGTLALAALVMLAPVEILEAQRGGPRRGRSVGAVEQALLHKQRLELTDDQVAELKSLRQEAVAHRKETLGEVLELESQTRSGQITGQELRARRETQRDHAQVRIETLRERFDGILTEAQRNELRSEARAAPAADLVSAARAVSGNAGHRDGNGDSMAAGSRTAR